MKSKKQLKIKRDTIRNKLDSVMRTWCRTIRSGGLCEYCGEPGKNPRDIQWCHIKSRKYLSVRWSENNCFCLCAAHHRYFADNPDEFYKWIDKKHKRQYKKLLKEFEPRTKFTLKDLEELLEEKKKWLEIEKSKQTSSDDVLRDLVSK